MIGGNQKTLGEGGKVDEHSCECSDARLFQVPPAAVLGVKRETGTLMLSKSGAAPATVDA